MRRHRTGHATAGAQPRHRAHRAIGEGAVVAVEAMQPAQEFALETVDVAADVDEVVTEVVTEGAVRQPVDRLRSQRVDGLAERTRSRRELHHHGVNYIRTDVRTASR